MKMVARIMVNPNQALTSLLLGNNAVNIMIILVANRLMQRIPIPLSNQGYESLLRFVVEVICIVSFLLIFGEIIPKSLALKYSHVVVRFTVSPFFLFHEFIGFLRIRHLVAFVSERLVVAVRRIFGDKEELANHEDIQLAVEMSMKGGHLSEEEASIVDRILELREAPISKIMIDRSMVKTVYPHDSVKNAIRLGTRNRISKLPVYDRKKDAVIGIFKVKKAILENQKGRVREFMSEPYFIPKVNAAEMILEMILHDRQNLAVVVDEFGTYAGIVTSSQILEYLTQSMVQLQEDEAQKEYTLTDHGLYVNANAKLEKIEEILKCTFPKGEYQTLGGFLITATGKIPKEREWLVIEGMKFYIDEARPNKIVRVFIQQKGFPS
jgi:CBS domain containing-hemolysin-like protein